MLFKRITPPPSLQPFIECYWVIEDEAVSPVCQKIIPDGFPEIIFHYGDPFRILINTEWELQENFLIAGQLTKFFYLENTGKTGVLGIKLKPTALTKLFGLSMKDYTDKVVSANQLSGTFDKIKQIISMKQQYESIIKELDEYFAALLTKKSIKQDLVDKAVETIFERKGMISVEELAASSFVSERQFLNHFRQQVGLPPKFFARIIRLNYIFQLVKENKEKWSSLAYEAAYFDQAHFIKDFKTFTGEKPNQYSFHQKNFANFFLLKK